MGLSDAADAVQLAQAAPWLAVGVLALVAAAWVFRQGRRGLAEVRAEAARSATAQGERLGRLERQAGLLDLRRRQVEWVLVEDGLPLPMWPPDGPQQRQPSPRAARDAYDDEHQADELPATQARPSIPVPPPDPVAARHRHA